MDTVVCKKENLISRKQCKEALTMLPGHMEITPVEYVH